MGVLGCCCKFTAVLVALFAVFVGALFSGHVKKTGIFVYLDKTSLQAKGIFPAFHEGEPWGFKLEDMPDLTGETHLVTGANVGLGYWSAHHLAAAKATVVIACRSQQKCSAAAETIESETGTKVATVLLDLGSLKSVRACAAEVASKYPSLDGLMLNAGVMMPPFGLTEDGLETQIGTNHFGHFLLTQLLLPQLEAASGAKGVATVVSVSSNAHYGSYPEGIRPTLASMNDEASYDTAKAYGQSKLANVLFGQELAARVQDKNILVNTIHPGGVDTELARHIETIINAYSPAAARWFKAKMSDVVWHPRDAALTQLYAAVGPDLRKKKITGKYYHPIARLTEPDAHASNAALQKNLWALTEEFVNAH